MGAVRVRVKYTNDYMLPLPSYARLLEFFYDDKLQAITAFGSVTDEREDVAKSLVRIAEYTNIPVKFLSILNGIYHYFVICCSHDGNSRRGRLVPRSQYALPCQFVGLEGRRLLYEIDRDAVFARGAQAGHGRHHQ